MYLWQAKCADTRAKSREDEPLPEKKCRSAKAKAGDDASKKNRTRARVDPSSSSRKVRVSQEKNAPAKAPRKRTKVRMDDTKGEKEHEDEPPKKKRRRAADPAVRYALTSGTVSLISVWGLTLDSRHRRKDDKEMTRSAREASVVTMDRVGLFSSFGYVVMWEVLRPLFIFYPSRCRRP
ncbi:hypothetical protein BGW80DRAFT_147485 [Lactifluus volemus]|nr:hypothetical protein BGW80DRAFT_147485 [Lactifluus volemus]